MADDDCHTWYANLSRLQARAVLTAWLCILSVFLVGASWPIKPGSEPPRGGGDLRLYRRIVERVHDGEGYYDVAGSELRANGYPAGSTFNWRPPLYAWLLGSLPSPDWGRGLVGLAALAALGLAWGQLKRELGPVPGIIGTLLLLGSFYWVVDGDAFFAQELWAGILLTLSALAYARGRWLPGYAAALAALFLRELALPACLVALFLAWRKRRWRECAAWLLGLALYGLYLYWHHLEVMRRITPEDRQHASWFQFGGPVFILATCRMNEFLFSLPAWVSALYLTWALFGLVGRKDETGIRLSLTVGSYVAAFAMVGQPFNIYWGLLYVPLLSFGVAWSAQATRELAQSLCINSRKAT